jgi:hypothetical protein
MILIYNILKGERDGINHPTNVKTIDLNSSTVKRTFDSHYSSFSDFFSIIYYEKIK